MSIESFKSAEESCRHFLRGDSSPEAKAYFCLSTGEETERQGDYKTVLDAIVRVQQLPCGSVVLKGRS